MTARTYRIGQIVPSSNTTMETEIPAMFRAREGVRPDERFTFHASRMRMHKVTKEELAAMNKEEVARANHCLAPVMTSAGALIEGLKIMGAKRVSIMAPYMRPLTDLVVQYIEHEGIEVIDSICFEIPDNLEVGRRDPLQLVEDVKRLNTQGADVIVASACVQMQSLAAVQRIQDATGIPTVSTAVCTVRRMLDHLGLEPIVPGAGALLGGSYR